MLVFIIILDIQNNYSGYPKYVLCVSVCQISKVNSFLDIHFIVGV